MRLARCRRRPPVWPSRARVAGLVRPVLAAASLVVALLGLAPAQARAWDDTGPMAVALIAWRHMRLPAQRAVIQMLGAAPLNTGIPALRPNGVPADVADMIEFVRAATW